MFDESVLIPTFIIHTYTNYLNSAAILLWEPGLQAGKHREKGSFLVVNIVSVVSRTPTEIGKRKTRAASSAKWPFTEYVSTVGK